MLEKFPSSSGSMKGNNDMRLPGFTAEAALYKMHRHYKTHLGRYDLAQGDHRRVGDVYAAGLVVAPCPPQCTDWCEACDKKCGANCTDLVPCWLDCYNACVANCPQTCGPCMGTQQCCSDGSCSSQPCSC